MLNNRIIIASFFTGFSSLACQVLLNRWLSTVVGASVYIQSALLFSFFLILGFGAYSSKYFLGKIKLINLIIGLYALALYLSWGNSFFLIESFTSSIFLKVLLTLIITSPIAFLTGLTIPIYSRMIKEKEYSSSFNRVYLFFHFGSALGLFLIETIVIPGYGIKPCFLTIFLLQLFLYFYLPKRYRIAVIKESPPLFTKQNNAIALLCIISGVFQICFLKIQIHFFGPYSENFTFLTCASLLSIALSSYIVEKFKISFNDWNRKIFPFLAFFIIYFWGLIYLWPYINDYSSVSPSFIQKSIKLVFICLLFMPSYSLFSALIPSLHISGNQNSRFLLSLNSITNALGYAVGIILLMTGIEVYLLMAILVLLTLTIPLYLSLETSYKLKTVSIALVLLWTAYFNQVIFHFSYRFFETPQIFKSKLQSIKSYQSFHFLTSDVDLLKEDDGTTLIIDGYKTVKLNPSHSINKYEMLLGVLQAFFPKERKSSLILGIGSGVTVTANSFFFQEVDAVEINPVIFKLLRDFKEYNMNLVEMPNVNLHLDDGFIFLHRVKKNYDLIVNNVPTPQYSASSNIWTQEFLILAKKRLKKGGVYSQWIDGATNHEAMIVITDTLRSVFPHCYLALLSNKYYNLICSEEKLSPKNISEIDPPKELNKSLGKIKFSELKHFLFEVQIRPETGPIVNSIEHPKLESALNNNLSKVWKERKNWYMLDYFKIKTPVEKEATCKALEKWIDEANTLNHLPFCKI